MDLVPGKDMAPGTDYGNWVPKQTMKKGWSATAILAGSAALLGSLSKRPLAAIASGILTGGALVTGGFTLTKHLSYHALDFNGGGCMGKIHQFLVEHLAWEEACDNLGIENGTGTILDVGCGAGALTNRCAKAFPEARIVGVDYWNGKWGYQQEQCLRNAQLEGVEDRVEFQHGDAACFDFADESFDAAVSTFVFHEVKTAANAQAAVRETLRIIKRGGAFSFVDLFGHENIYGDMEAFAAGLLADGTVSRITYIPDIEDLELVPFFVKTPWMIKHAGLLYGIR